ncbi:MAG: NADH-quinone oxidoreductase subunit H [Bacteroidales bacterium]|nr:NADH-quinone oxidoreductase subunit H [Bacteroidales bacterium]MDD3132843.1 NADH-quinone oxidoreductase subunit H [Bacteroidales bacterium]MDD3527842.1 NADH-quinone oxidoreductase subunit H [Bacteroidales bacterium]MDY0334403.1 NADH-quinone oxidoreductase subunit H [Bacteroidales bacterium]
MVLILISSLFFVGIIVKVKAKIAARRMPPILQPVYDAIRLFKKGAVYSRTTSVVFKIAPLIYFASALVATLFVPIGSFGAFLSFEGDFVFFAYLMGLGKFMMIVSAMDTGSGFEGMGANRESLYSMLVEPAFFILMGSVALFTNNISFHDLFLNFNVDTNLSYIIGIASIYVLVFITMVENSRMPVDDPKTHLELTMVHEVMVLDNSGFDLALIHIASWLKFSIFGALISNFIIQSSWAAHWQIAAFFGIQVAFSVAVGMLEAFRARNKMEKNPQWILMLSAISIVIFLTVLIITQKIILN